MLLQIMINHIKIKYPSSKRKNNGLSYKIIIHSIQHYQLVL